MRQSYCSSQVSTGESSSSKHPYSRGGVGVGLKLASCGGSSPRVAGGLLIDQCALSLLSVIGQARCPESSGKREDGAPCVVRCMLV